MEREELVVESGDGARLSASRVGSGPPLVLVHGGLLGMAAWQFVTPLLAERHTVWTYDRRGHGATPLGADHSADREVDDLAAVIAAAGADVHLVGHSVGASLCLEAACVLANLRSLVLYEPAVHFDRMQDVFRRALVRLRQQDMEGFVEVFLTEVAAVTAEEVALVRSMPETWLMLVEGARRYAEASVVFAANIEASIEAGWQPERYRSLGLPTLLLVGARTSSPLFVTPDEMRAAVPHVDVAALDGQAHMAAAFDPHHFAEAVLAFVTAH